MAKRVVGLIGNGAGPVVHTEGNCTVMVEGLREGGFVTISLDTGETFFTKVNGPIKVGTPRHVRFEARDACRSLVCNVLMEA